MRKYLVSFLLAVSACAVIASSCVAGVTYYMPKSTLRIVDANGLPVADALVLLRWTLFNGQYTEVRPLRMYEGLTDRNGSFEVPEWGPEQVDDGALDPDQPELRVFKPGYLPVIASNVNDIWSGARSARKTIQLIWSREDIVLRRSDRASEEYGLAVRRLADSLGFYLSDQHCTIRKAHALLDAVDREVRQVLPPTDPVSYGVRANEIGCATTEK